ncbi:hypothetical protein EYZ11_011666 [Aspergillus tanneri]|uniref:Uncharacterized protein n=1 Tax=Aspergillus tanneri TaxID=1220188 RepID=A0A4S3J4D4_9EURO|nr:hypothetical protein EYZ11_011666 [Aspergillus tanneri]
MALLVLEGGEAAGMVAEWRDFHAGARVNHAPNTKWDFENGFLAFKVYVSEYFSDMS